MVKDGKKELDKLVSLTFDSDPEVRKKAAMELAQSDEPGALLAIIELSYDKNEDVAETAKKILAERKKKTPLMKPFHELFKGGVDFSGSKKKEIPPSRAKILEPIERIFREKLKDEKKVEAAMKEFMRRVKVMEKGREEKPITQEAIKTAYLETMDAINVEKPGEEAAEEKGKKKVSKESKEKAEEEKVSAATLTPAAPGVTIEEVEKSEEKEGVELALIGSSEINEEKVARESGLIEKDELFTLEEKKLLEPAESEGKEGKLPNILRYVYNHLLSFKGDEKLAKQEAKLLQDFFKKQVDLAYKLAKKKFKEIKITDISDVKSGMRNITTDMLEVVEVKHLKYRKKRKEELFTRVIVRDKQGKEGVIYLFEDRGRFLQEGMKIRLEKAKAKTFDFSNETALTVDKRGHVIVEM